MMGIATSKLMQAPRIDPDALPCPFCGGPADIQFWHGGGPSKRMLRCADNGCDVQPRVTGATRKVALEKWNYRV